MRTKVSLLLIALCIFSTSAQANTEVKLFRSLDDIIEFAEKIPYRIPKLKNVMKTLGAPSQEQLFKDDISILVWNMYKGDKPTWSQDYDFLAKGQDILMLQEMYLNENMMNKFENHTGFEYHTATSFINMAENARTGVATAARVEPVRSFFQRSRVREPVINTPKMSIFTLYNILDSEEHLLTVNIHAVNFVPTFSLQIQLNDIAKEIRNHKGPVVFAGDFNTWSPGKTNMMKKLMKRLQMTEVTFAKDTRMRTFGHILDYVFVRGLEVKSSKVWGHIEGSDHKALEVTLRVK